MANENKPDERTASKTFKDDRLLTIREVAELTGLSVGSLYHFVSEGRIPVIRISGRCLRFRLSALYEWWDRLAEEDVHKK